MDTLGCEIKQLKGRRHQFMEKQNPNMELGCPHCHQVKGEGMGDEDRVRTATQGDGGYTFPFSPAPLGSCPRRLPWHFLGAPPRRQWRNPAPGNKSALPSPSPLSSSRVALPPAQNSLLLPSNPASPALRHRPPPPALPPLWAAHRAPHPASRSVLTGLSSVHTPTLHSSSNTHPSPWLQIRPSTLRHTSFLCTACLTHPSVGL